MKRRPRHDLVHPIDYCNSILHQTAAVHLRPHQLVLHERCCASGFHEEENGTVSPRPFATIFTGFCCDSVYTGTSRFVYLPLLVYKCLHQLATPYLVSMISPVSAVSTRRHLRSAGQGDLVVLRTRTAGFGPRSFSVAGPSSWNSLPPKIKTASVTLGQPLGRLKTEMFLRSYYVSAQTS